MRIATEVSKVRFIGVGVGLLVGMVLGIYVLLDNRALSWTDRLILYLYLQLLVLGFSTFILLCSILGARALSRLPFVRRSGVTAFFITLFSLLLGVFALYRRYLYMIPAGPERALETIGQAKFAFYSGCALLLFAAFALGLVGLRKLPALLARLAPYGTLVKRSCPALIVAGATVATAPLRIETQPSFPPDDLRETQIGKIVIVGVDGASWDVIDTMRDKGRLPNRECLLQQRCRVPEDARRRLRAWRKRRGAERVPGRLRSR
jgi:hypothetical protein